MQDAELHRMQESTVSHSKSRTPLMPSVHHTATHAYSSCCSTTPHTPWLPTPYCTHGRWGNAMLYVDAPVRQERQTGSQQLALQTALPAWRRQTQALERRMDWLPQALQNCRKDLPPRAHQKGRKHPFLGK